MLALNPHSEVAVKILTALEKVGLVFSDSQTSSDPVLYRDLCKYAKFDLT